MAKRNPVEEASKWVEKTRASRKALNDREAENNYRKAYGTSSGVIDPSGHSPFQRKKK